MGWYSGGGLNLYQLVNSLISQQKKQNKSNGKPIKSFFSLGYLTLIFIIDEKVSVFVLNGWQLNILEAIVVTINIRLSLDFSEKIFYFFSLNILFYLVVRRGVVVKQLFTRIINQIKNKKQDKSNGKSIESFF